MRNALRVLPAFLALAALAGCHKQTPQSDQNVAIDINNVSPNDIETLPESARIFFTKEFADRQYNDTKMQIKRRLYGIVENQTFKRMFSAPRRGR